MKKLVSVAGALLFSLQSMADVTITPRVSYFFDNALQRSSDVDGIQQSELAAAGAEADALLKQIYGPDASYSYEEANFGTQAEQISVPMYGGSISFGSDRTQFTLTGLTGDTSQGLEATGNARTAATVNGFIAEDLITMNTNGQGDIKRLDIEATIQHRLNESFALIGGVRYERLETDQVVSSIGYGSLNTVNLLNLINGIPDIDLTLSSTLGERTYTATDELYSARFGASAYAPIGRNSGAFLIGMLHVSHQPESSITLVDSQTGPAEFENLFEDETTAGPDVSVGLQFGLSENVSIDLRYRATVYFPISSSKGTNDSRINHGASLGFSIRL